ncbi:MAG: cellulase family glycosylhydrolase, partial [bacterium]
GLCEDYPEETTTLEIIRNDMELLKRTGVNLLRISFGWDAIEAKKDQYDWLFWDDYVKMAVDEYGVTLIPYICYMPKWNSKGAADTLYFWNYPPVEAEQFGEFMQAIVSRYKKWIKTWELWNEPDIWIYWQGTPEEFANMIKIGAKAVKEADPDAKVVLGGVAYSEGFVEKLFRDYGLSPYVDVVNMHNYYETWNEQPVENIDDHILKMSEVIKNYGNHQPLWMAEVGYSTFRQGSKVSSEYTAYYEYEHKPEYQAVDLFKRLALIVSTEKISAIAWYEIKDLTPTDEVIGDEYNNRHLGVAYVNHSPKPAQQALMFFNQLFSQKYKNITNQVFVERSKNSDSHVLVFQNEDRSVIIVGWLQTNIPEKRVGNSNGDVKDNRQEILSISFPFELRGKAMLFDHLGTEKACDRIKLEKKKTIIENIELKGGEVVIIKLDRK